MNTLYTTKNKTEYYLIPTGTDLPIGTLSLRTMAGQERLVDHSTVVEYAISQAEVEQYLQQTFQEGAEQIKTALFGALNMVQEALSQPETKRPPRQESPLAKALFGHTVEEMRQDESVLEDGARRFAHSLGQVLAGIRTDEPSKREAAREELQAARSRFAESGVEIDEAWDDLADRLSEQISPEKREKRKAELATLYNQLADELTKAVPKLTEALQKEAEALNKS